MIGAANVFASAFSPDGEWLACGDSLGHLHVWRVADYLSNDWWVSHPGELTPAPLVSVKAAEGEIYALESLDRRDDGAGALVGGTAKDMRVWDWGALVHLAESEASFAAFGLKPTLVCAPTSPKLPGLPVEVNGLAVDGGSNVVYGACGDGNAYGWDLKTGEVVHTFAGHSDFLHCVALQSARRALVTGSEDGSVRIWDLKTHKSTKILDIERGEALDGGQSYENAAAGPLNDKWVGAVALDPSECWLSCGTGSGALTVWELRTMSVSAVMAAPGAVQATAFLDGEVVSAGWSKALHYWSPSGHKLRSAATSQNAVFSVTRNAVRRHQATVVTGTSALVDVYIAKGSKAFSLRLPDVVAAAE